MKSSKRLAICGDSFCTGDPSYGTSWTDVFIEKHSDLKVDILASVGASNYLIYLQIQHAILQNYDYIIYNSTSSIRQEFLVGQDSAIRDHVNRYDDITNPSNSKSMISTSWLTPTTHWDFEKDKQSVISNFFKEFVDMPNIIEKNYIFIAHILKLLSDSNITWAWSRGGFEHKSFSTATDWDFSEYQHKEIKTNLWDHYDPSKIRPYFHITDEKIIKKVCKEYTEMLQLNNV